MKSDVTRKHTWGRIELPLRAVESYDFPYLEVEVAAEFKGPGGRRLTIPGFWDGENLWKIRFAPPCPGVWRWETRSKSERDAGLHGRKGTVKVPAYRGDNPVYQHGFLRRAEDRRCLSRADGTPFLWLGDTCWASLLKASDEEWRHYVERRVAQRFNVLQTTVFFHSGWFRKDNGPVFADIDRYETPNVDFFRSMDRKIALANDQGMAVVLTILWHTATPWTWMKPPNLKWDGPKLSPEQAVSFVEYLVARYAAFDVVWVTTGDGLGGGKRWAGELAKEAVLYNDAMGETLLGMDPYHHPAGVHPAGGRRSGEFFKERQWMDFNMYQTHHKPEDHPSHAAHYKLVLDACNDERHLPVIAGEPCYETSDASRAKAFGVRRAAHWSFLSGASGFTYGAFQVFKWWRGTLEEGDPAFWAKDQDRVDVTWRDQLDLEGANQLRHIVGMLDRVAWWTLKPSQELLIEDETDPLKHVVAAASDTVQVFYAPDNEAVKLDRAKSGFVDAKDAPTGMARWFNPSSGEYGDAPYAIDKTAIVFRTPRDRGRDWILIVERAQDRRPQASRVST